MAYRFRERYQAVLGKRHHLSEAGSFSMPDEVGAKVAILAPFVMELVYDKEDSQQNFEKQTTELMDHYASQDYDPYNVMGATPADFEKALTDKSVVSVVVEGFGNFSAVAAPFAKDRNRDARYGYLDWQHLAGMSTHLKMGEFVMYTCCGFYREFNPPLAAGVVSEYSHIRAPIGRGLQAIGMEENEPLMQPITDKAELSYDEVKGLFPLQRRMGVPVVPEPAYVAARGIFNRIINPDVPRQRPVSIPYPDLREYL